jgi:hypothetical protein
MKQTKFAELAGVSRAAISKAVKVGKLICEPKLGIDAEHPVNLAYLQNQGGVKTRKNVRDSAPKKSTPAPKPAKKTTKKPKKLPPASNKAVSVEEMEHFDIGEQEDLFETYDLNGKQFIDRPTAERLKIIEMAREKQIKREQLRGKLIDRDNVSAVFNMIYKVDTGELRPLGDKLAPELAAICGIDDDKLIKKMNEYIQEEIHTTLEHIKRLVNDGLEKMKVKEIE